MLRRYSDGRHLVEVQKKSENTGAKGLSLIGVIFEITQSQYQPVQWKAVIFFIKIIAATTCQHPQKMKLELRLLL